MWNNFFLAISFFTTLKVPYRSFTKENYRYLILLISSVGVIIGFLSWLLLIGLNLLPLTLFFKAMVLTLFFPLITGGLHLDGLLDSADAYFSRRSKQDKLKIMHDSRIGAFACITCILFFIIKITLFYELLTINALNINLILLPVFSRAFASLLICVTPFASKEGLARMYEGVLEKYYKYIIIFQILFFLIISFFIDYKVLLSSLSLIIYFYLFKNWALKNFGGITGDILGTFIETSEVWLLFILVGLNL